ncbi:ScbR family autoregulator-binding transcription factor [Actinocrinis sp.]|jgi:AcrR family transcriptional regulator|uniref:ScbR family autoregulator-binding transcription factor n=1 Tax=Actinocrinis sp. TaxID=1920516 RepID=UPI002C3CB1BB|nr:ScbR family autoregulator-binding transcription factor [Actinocrinis sp.]HXR71947.1 ScbR family autoregulator-binding transcription factor [Actinocrinis sp.]
MAQQERAVRTREAVVRAAAEAFADAGFLATSMADIFARAGVTKGALYFHFTSKEELAFAIIDAEEQAAGELIESVMSTDSPPLQKLIDISFRWAHLIQSNPIVQAGLRMIIEQGTYSRPMPLPYNAWQELSAQLLTQAQERGELERSVDVRNMAEFIVSSFTGAQIVSQVVSGHKDLVQRVERMWQLLLKGILPPGNPIVFFPRFES